GSGYSRKDVCSNEAFPESTWELEEPRTPLCSGFGVLCPWAQQPHAAREQPWHSGTCPFAPRFWPGTPTASQTISRSLEDAQRSLCLVICWWGCSGTSAWADPKPPDSLNYKDCEKAVRKHHIDGPRFLNLAENDIQKFPKLRVPILSKLSQEINKNEERRSIFTRKPQVQRFPEETESHEEDNGGWSSFVSTGQAVLPPCSGFQSNSVIRNVPNARRSKAQIEPPRGQIMRSVKGRG
uniref:Lymphocyte cytosolic protein 2 n=1 Tax=Sus scrofa TaxID=9823 RepID=A0A8W4FGA5_PIG